MKNPNENKNRVATLGELEPYINLLGAIIKRAIDDLKSRHYRYSALAFFALLSLNNIACLAVLTLIECENLRA